MAIARRPTEKATNLAPVDEKKIEALINKGGSSIQSKKSDSYDEDAVKPVLLRLYQSQISEIDQLLEQLPKRQRVSRHAYIVQAVEEKMQRDRGKKK